MSVAAPPEEENREGFLWVIVWSAGDTSAVGVVSTMELEGTRE